MSAGVYLKCCSKEYQITTGDQREESKCGKCWRKNLDITLIVVAIIFAILSPLIAYGYIPVMGTIHPMYSAGGLAACASFSFVWGVIHALRTRGCIIVKSNDSSS